MISKCLDKIKAGELLSREDALSLVDAPIEELAKAADDLRKEYCGSSFDMCTIINAKSGKCSEDCKFCAQSAFYNTGAQVYPFLDKEAIVEQAKYNARKGVKRYSLVTSGKRLGKEDVLKAAEAVKQIVEETDLKVCMSVGLLDVDSYKILKEAGADRVHNNLESSPAFFKTMCSTHTTDDKIAAIMAAKEAGMEVCCGGIIGLGESMEDRIDMALKIRELDVQSIPVNVLNPIPGTPLAGNRILSMEEIRRTIAIYRFLIPNASIRLAGGRGNMEEGGRILFESGANATISGDMLTTSGYTIDGDMKMFAEMGFDV